MKPNSIQAKVAEFISVCLSMRALWPFNFVGTSVQPTMSSFWCSIILTTSFVFTGALEGACDWMGGSLGDC